MSEATQSEADTIIITPQVAASLDHLVRTADADQYELLDLLDQTSPERLRQLLAASIIRHHAETTGPAETDASRRPLRQRLTNRMENKIKDLQVEASTKTADGARFEREKLINTASGLKMAVAMVHESTHLF